MSQFSQKDIQISVLEDRERNLLKQLKFAVEKSDAKDFRVNRLEQYIMAMGYSLPSMGDSSEVKWTTPKADIRLLREALIDEISSSGYEPSEFTVDVLEKTKPDEVAP